MILPYGRRTRRPWPFRNRCTLINWAPKTLDTTIRFLQSVSYAFVMASTIAGSVSCLGQSYPSKPIRIVVTVAPGSGLDARAREIAQGLPEYLGQPVVVENKPGGGGIIAAGAVAKSAPDGYTFLLGGVSVVSYYPVLYKKLPYSADDFVPVSLLATGPTTVYANPSVPATSLKELITYAKAHPGELTFASPGEGTFQHLAGEMFRSRAGVSMLHVPYKDYSQLVTDLQGGRISVLFDSTGALMAHVQAGRLKAFAVTGAHRIAGFPNVPTFAEAGLPAHDAAISYGLLAPQGTPQAIVETVSFACAKVQRAPDIQERLSRFGFTPRGTTPAEFKQFIGEERARWSAVIKETGVQLDF